MGNIKHGDAKVGGVTRLHDIWRGMLKRCSAKSGPAHEKYAKRGIRVCSAWSDYIVFKAWALDAGYQAPLSIERIDNDGDYTPENCRWITMAEQAKNRRTSRKITAFGRTQILSEWCREFSIDASLLAYRQRRGMSVEEALSAPIRRQPR